MANPDLVDQVRLFLPKYLSPERQEALRRELLDFPENRTIYTTRNNDPEPLQGDGWRGFVAIDFVTRQDKIVSGVVLSNSCDIAPGNRRALVPNITFVPLARVRQYLELLRHAGQTEQQLEDVHRSLRRQQITSLFYLPAIQDVLEESIAVFHDARPHPLDDFLRRERSLIFRLSDFGFYLFLFKLSIHFTRMMEGVER